MTAVERILEIAAGEVGVKESPAGSNRVKYNTWFYGREVSGSSYPWCCAFICWLFHQAGMEDLVRRTGGCTTMMNWFKAKGRLVPVKEAKPGDLVFYQFDKDAYADHIGIVEKVNKSGVAAIEGNTSVTSDDNGGAVMRRTRKWSVIMAAARPDYAAERKEDGMKETEVRFQTVEEVPQWAREDIRALMDSGALKGGDGGLALSMDMVRLLAVMARLHRKGGEVA